MKSLIVPKVLFDNWVEWERIEYVNELFQGEQFEELKELVVQEETDRTDC